MIIQTFFVTALSGSIFKDITGILKSPGDIFPILGNSLPSRSSFFMQLTFVRTTTTFVMEGLGIIRIVKAWIREHVGPTLTERERNMPVFGT